MGLSGKFVSLLYHATRIIPVFLKRRVLRYPVRRRVPQLKRTTPLFR